MSSTAWAVVFAISLCGCSSGSSTSTSGGASGGPGQTPGVNEPVALPDGSSVPGVSCGDESVASATGTWDVITSGGRAGQSAGVITIDASSFIVATPESTLSFTVSGDRMTLTWKDGRDDVVPIAVTHAAAPLDTGVIPLAAGGKWTFASNTSGAETCSASLSGSNFNATCSRVKTPFGYIEGALVALREQEKSSVFGALGGKWHFTGARKGSLDATVSGNVFTAVVSGDAGIAGRDAWLTIKLCNGTAAGKASNGLEIAATRR